MKKIKVIDIEGAYPRYIGKQFEVEREAVLHYFIKDNDKIVGILKPHCEEVFDITGTGFGVVGTTPPSIKFDIQSVKKIRRFPSGAVRSDDTGRARPDWVSAWAIEAIGQHLANNSNDFGATNYLLGIPIEECLASLMRHYCTYQKTKSKADLTALAFNAIAALHTACIKDDGTYKEIHEKTELI
jgi:hypothetical protein